MIQSHRCPLLGFWGETQRIHDEKRWCTSAVRRAWVATEEALEEEAGKGIYTWGSCLRVTHILSCVYQRPGSKLSLGDQHPWAPAGGWGHSIRELKAPEHGGWARAAPGACGVGPLPTDPRAHTHSPHTCAQQRCSVNRICGLQGDW